MAEKGPADISVFHMAGQNGGCDLEVSASSGPPLTAHSSAAAEHQQTNTHQAHYAL